MKSHWPKQPIIYEINTWVWLHELSQRHKRPIHLGTVPGEEWDVIVSLNVNAVWLMGVWERSPTGIRIARENQDLYAEFRRALPDFKIDDVVGSPYCIHRYVVDQHLGGPKGLATARKQLAARGIRLILDFVPNHVAPDHPWIFDHPEYFIRGNAEDLAKEPTAFFEAGGNIFAHGRDPYFPPWQDTAQLNALHPGLRQAAIDALWGIVSQCDGVRCDMAMLLMNRIFQGTWESRAGVQPATEYWRNVIQAVGNQYPDVLFMAEAYWDLESELQQQGFDFCYDKELYDRLKHETAEGVSLHLLADPAYQGKLVRFIENHDEPRAALIFSPERERAAAVTIATLPGAKLFHEGQFEGRKVKLPVFLGRRPDELPDLELQAFYARLLNAIHTPVFQEGEWHLCERSGWPDNQSYRNLVAWCWRKEKERSILVVNLSDQRSEARVRLPWDELAGLSWRLADVFRDKAYDRDGSEMRDPGLYVDLKAWNFHFLKF
jgi:hypothetical protein